MKNENLLTTAKISANEQTFQQYLATQSLQIDIVNFIINLFLTAILAFCLSIVYKRYGTSISNRSLFGGNFILIATTTMLIISVVKSSLALSLGLVGALSIVRFRAAIKEPEELAYLFLVIAIGLGMGANQRMTTIVALIIIIIIIYLKSFKKQKLESNNLFLTISSEVPEKLNFEGVVDVLKKYCNDVSLQRFDEGQNNFDLSFLVEFSDHMSLDNCRKDLQKLYPSINISFLDYKGLGAN